jgi:(1->4)-alpha-D-glucan 1-alpha-D-glucosylmutase
VAREPQPTYRVQVRPDFDLAATAAIADYLAALGAGMLYSAPLLAATPGSAHGYDVVDPTRVNPQLGGREALLALRETLRANGLGLLVDIVPNHLGVSRPECNPAWWSVLREGADSPYARWFDIDWERGPLLIPVLADDGAVSELRVEDGELRYYQHRYPLAAGTEGGDPREVHERQHYRLVDWRRGGAELTYRRFFAVSDLAGVRVEDLEVFEATHAEILRWVAEGLVDGLRVDHPDGLRDPGEYLRRLRERAPDVWLLVEKILEYGEALPGDWPVDGTTGYDALREVCGVFLDPDAAAHFPTGVPFTVAARDGKLEAATGLLAAELARLTRLAPQHPDTAAALAHIAAYFPVYRSYLPAGTEHLQSAVTAANNHHLDAVQQLEGLLADPQSELAQRFQQYTGAVMAKGVEDTAYYRWTRFVALNEVGGAPDRFGVPPHEFHTAMLDRLRWQPLSMTTLSTHDTKRGEDVRARLAVLAECPREWWAMFGEWSAATTPLGDADLAQLLWQTAVGAWPIERERLHAYAEKAAREQATRTTWVYPDPRFEAALHEVVDAMYDAPGVHEHLAAFVAWITPYGWANSLGQKLVQLTMPGVPDTYQGTELWDNSLVDPDNRRPVDFGARRSLLAKLDAGWLPPIDASGAVKLLVTSRALRLRRDRPDLFTAYQPVHAGRHVVAFDRGGAVTVATRLPLTLARAGGSDPGLRLPLAPGLWRDVLTGRVHEGLALREVLDRYPVALLVREDRLRDAGQRGATRPGEG